MQGKHLDQPPNYTRSNNIDGDFNMVKSTEDRFKGLGQVMKGYMMLGNREFSHGKIMALAV